MQAALDAAQAQLTRLTEGARPEDESAALAALNAARATWQDLQDGPDEEVLIEARAQLANAEAALQQAQSAYNKVKWRNDIGMLPESLQLQQATNQYTAAKAHYEELAKGADSAEIANAQAQVEQAGATLQRLRKPARDSEIAAAAAEVRRTQAQLALIQAGVRPELVAAAVAEVAAAQAALLQAEAALAETILKAPFAGAVAALDVKVGEAVAPGVPLIQLGDLRNWQIETDDLSEVDITKVQEGSQATITFDGIPNLTLTGKVMRIKAFGEDKAGDLTYTVFIKPDRSDARLRWNMNAKVIITAK